MALAQDMLAGAQLVNMGWQRQERMQELRAQQAMNQIRERQLAAEAEFLTERARDYRLQVDQKVEEERSRVAFGAAVGETFQKNLAQSMDPETGEADLPMAVVRTGAVLQKISPELANKWMQSHSGVLSNNARVRAADINAASRERTADTNAASRERVADMNAKARMEAAKERVKSSSTWNTIENRMDLQRKIIDAEDSGDFDNADLLRDNLRALDSLNPGLRQQGRQKENARLSVLKNKIAQLDKNLSDLSLKSSWSKIKTERDQLQNQLENWKTETPMEQYPPPRSRKENEPTQSGGAQEFILGKTYRHPNGKNYIFKGGDANDPASWQEAK